MFIRRDQYVLIIANNLLMPKQRRRINKMETRKNIHSKSKLQNSFGIFKIIYEEFIRRIETFLLYDNSFISVTQSMVARYHVRIFSLQILCRQLSQNPKLSITHLPLQNKYSCSVGTMVPRQQRVNFTEKRRYKTLQGSTAIDGDLN